MGLPEIFIKDEAEDFYTQVGKNTNYLMKFLSAFRRRLCPPSPVLPGVCLRWR